MLILTMLLTMVGCGQKSAGDDTPDGYAPASVPSTDGYALYVPLGWTIYRDRERCGAYLSGVADVSVSVSKVESPLAPKAFFEASHSSFMSGTKDMAIEEEQETTISKQPAYVVYYTATVREKAYGVAQAIVKASDTQLYVLTAKADHTQKEGQDTTPYQTYRSTMANIIGYFALSEITSPAVPPTFEGTAPEGMKPAANSQVLGCHVFVPESWTILASDGYVSAATSDGTNLQVNEIYPSEHTSTISEYFSALAEQYKTMFDSVLVVSEASTPEIISDCPGYRYVIEVTHKGIDYRVEQMIVVRSSLFDSAAYLLTFTAQESNFDTHQAEWQQILEALSFS